MKGKVKIWKWKWNYEIESKRESETLQEKSDAMKQKINFEREKWKYEIEKWNYERESKTMKEKVNLWKRKWISVWWENKQCNLRLINERWNWILYFEMKNWKSQWNNESCKLSNESRTEETDKETVQKS